MSRLFRHARLWMFVYGIYGLPVAPRAENVTDWIGTQFATAKEHVVQTIQEGRSDLYISGYVWHASDGYTREDRERLNAHAYGGGFGKSKVNESRREDALYAIVFADSHYDPQPIAGYARQWFTPSIASFVSFGAGYTIALSARSDSHYIPFPIVLPLATVRVHRFSLMGTGLPRGLVKGSIFFVWGSYAF